MCIRDRAAIMSAKGGAAPETDKSNSIADTNGAGQIRQVSATDDE